MWVGLKFRCLKNSLWNIHITRPFKTGQLEINKHRNCNLSTVLKVYTFPKQNVTRNTSFIIFQTNYAFNIFVRRTFNVRMF